ncbi:MAG: hypothetical protein H6719_35760 [Sandaracinaceae bacterium]|nr:hypothetical protein [Sandaracinaceae bacterium]
MRRLRWLGAALLLLTACDPATPSDAGPTPMDAGGLDAGTLDGGGLDAATSDAGGADAGGADAATSDAGAFDAGLADAIGALSGACGEIDDELLSPESFLFENAIDFGPVPLMEMDITRLSPGAQELLMEGTIGGSSIYSEAIAYEVLYRCEGAALLKSESEIVYMDPMGTHTDMLVDIDGHRVGVSVVRAVGFPRDAPYPLSQAMTLLMRKVGDVTESSASVADEDRWVKQILHVIAYAPMHADAMRMAWAMIDPAVRADTILVITVTDGEDAFIYDNML